MKMLFAIFLFGLSIMVVHAQNTKTPDGNSVKSSSANSRIVVPMSVYEALAKNKRRIELQSVIHEDPQQDGTPPAGCHRDCEVFEICNASNKCYSKKLCWLVCED